MHIEIYDISADVLLLPGPFRISLFVLKARVYSIEKGTKDSQGLIHYIPQERQAAKRNEDIPALSPAGTSPWDYWVGRRTISPILDGLSPADRVDSKPDHFMNYSSWSRLHRISAREPNPNKRDRESSRSILAIFFTPLFFWYISVRVKRKRMAEFFLAWFDKGLLTFLFQKNHRALLPLSVTLLSVLECTSARKTLSC